MRALTRAEAVTALGLAPGAELDDEVVWCAPLGECVIPADIEWCEAQLGFTGIAVAVYSEGRYLGALDEDALPGAMAFFAKAGGRARIPVVLEHRNQAWFAYVRR